MRQLTGRERVMRIFRNQEVDRPSLKLWGIGVSEELLHPAYGPVCELGRKHTDIYASTSWHFEAYSGRFNEQNKTYEVRDTKSPVYKDRICTYKTPKGSLTETTRISTVGGPEYITEHFVKEPEDLEKILSLDYEPYPFSGKYYFDLDGMVGDKGITMFGLSHAGYDLQRLMGSETLAYFSVDCRELLHEALSIFSGRTLAYLKEALSAGIRGVFAWVGPEVFTPPLLSPDDFEDFVYKYDKPVCDMIHDAGSFTWVHCHNKVSNFVGRFIDMGVDVLNPLEPPKNGDIRLSEIIGKYGSRIGWEGNIQIQEIIQAEPERLKELIRVCVEEGSKSGRFILCPSAGFMEYPFPEEKYISNLLLYMEEGYRQVESCRKM